MSPHTLLYVTYVTVTVFTQFSHRPHPGKQIRGGKIGACRLGRPRSTRAEMAPAGAAISRPAGKRACPWYQFNEVMGQYHLRRFWAISGRGCAERGAPSCTACRADAGTGGPPPIRFWLPGCKGVGLEAAAKWRQWASVSRRREYRLTALAGSELQLTAVGQIKSPDAGRYRWPASPARAPCIPALTVP